MVDLGIGTYLRTDAEIARAVSAGMEGRNLHYLRRPEVNQLVAQKYLDEQGVTLDPHTQIFLTGGARTAITLALLRSLEPGERVVIPDPDYVGLASRCARVGCGGCARSDAAGTGWCLVRGRGSID